MRQLLFLLFCLTALYTSAQPSNKLHFKSVLVDTHNDVLSSGMLDGIDISHRVKEGHSDLVRWREGGLDIQFFSVWTGAKPRTSGGFYNDAIGEISLLEELLKKNPYSMTLAHNYDQVKKGIRKEKLVALIGVEGGHMIEDDLKKLDALFDRGMRYMTLTWNNSTSWASSAMDETSAKAPPKEETSGDAVQRKGLTAFGKQVVQRMNELGVIVDLSHVGEQAFYDAIATSTKPVLLSHSSVWSICPVFRNVKDDQIKAVAKNGGVICINFYSGFISRKWDETQKFLLGPHRKELMETRWKGLDSLSGQKEWKKYYDETLDAVRPTLAELVDHIDHIVKLVGDEYVGIGSDYDGIGSLPLGMDDVTSYPKITDELLRRGYSKGSIKKILGENVLRVMKANFR